VGIATIVWVFVTQADKLVISAAVPLSEFGFFSAAVSAAGAVSILSVSVTQGLLPRLVQLHALAEPRPLITLYRRATRFSIAAGAAVSLTLITMGEPLLWAWTGNRAFAASYALVLALYAAGNTFMLLGAFPYGLQHAAGNLRLHVAGNLLLAAIVVPVLPHVAATHGAVGTAWLWLGGNAGFFLLWTPLVHRRFAPGLHARWMLRDVLLVSAAPCSLALLAVAAGLPGMAQTRPGAAVLAGSLFTVLLIAGACGTGEVGRRLREHMDRKAHPGRDAQIR
jgi:O-antigen/teichoic acid export membrane protein